jgi:hypothetical protein
MKPTKYELFERDGTIVLRGYAAEAQNGWFNVEVVTRISWRTVPSLRKQAARLRCALGRPVGGQPRQRRVVKVSQRQADRRGPRGICFNTRRMSASCWASFPSTA